MPITKRQLRQMLREARDLLNHNTTSHVQRDDGTYAGCAACDLEARIDEATR